GMQNFGLCRAQAGFHGNRVMDECYQGMLFTQSARGFRQNPEGETVDKNLTGCGHHKQPRLCGHQRFPAGPWKILTKSDDVNCPAELFELGDHAPVVRITAGRRCKVARNCEGKPLHHKFASYEARATCDSDSVTRIALS